MPDNTDRAHDILDEQHSALSPLYDMIDRLRADAAKAWTDSTGILTARRSEASQSASATEAYAYERAASMAAQAARQVLDTLVAVAVGAELDNVDRRGEKASNTTPAPVRSASCVSHPEHRLTIQGLAFDRVRIVLSKIGMGEEITITREDWDALNAFVTTA